MYPEYFGLSEPSFSITPDPHYLFLSARHREALAHLLYGTGETGGFVQLTGEVGTGKTTVCRAFLEQVPEEIDIALILNPTVDELELLYSICTEFGISTDDEPSSTRRLVDRLNEYLLAAHAAGRRPVLIIDEAQNLNRDVLEQIRLLTNLETAKHKLLQIFLIGQPELRDLLQREDLRQLAQRVTARYHLQPLNLQETREYIQHRLAVAGCQRQLFTDKAVRSIYRCTGGVPRLINILCDRALLGGYAGQKTIIDKSIVHKAARELQITSADNGGHAWRKTGNWLLAGLVAVTVAVLLVFLWARQPDHAKPVAQQSIAEIPAKPVTSITEDSPDPGPPQPMVPDLERIIAASTGAESKLLTLWQADAILDASKPLCAQLDDYNLRCFQGRGTWNNLRHINRPALIQLRLPGPDQATILVTGLDTDKAQISTKDSAAVAPIAALDPYWYGDFTVIWRPTEMGTRVIGPGRQGDPVAWLRNQFLQLNLAPPPMDTGSTYDDKLHHAVELFQRREGLPADGLVGPDTHFYLNNGTRPAGEPHLKEKF